VTRSAALLSLALLFAPQAGLAQDSPSSSDPAAVLLDALEVTLRTNYIFQDRVPTIMDHLRVRHEAGTYRDPATPDVLAQALTSDLVEASQDLHFAVGVDPAWIASHREQAARIEEIERDERADEESSNHGFVRAAILAGNVGYLRFDYFANPEYAHETAAAAMQFVQHSDALILDMRYNRGGHMNLVQFLVSYLFSPREDQLLFEYVFPDEGGERVDRVRVLPFVPGLRMTEVPVMVLTATTTFSAGEWLPYVLQKLDRAIIVGRRTAGAAHSVTRVPIDDEFFLQVPASRTRDPVDGADFEGEGVTPDVDVPSYRALDVAHRLLLVEASEHDPNLEAAWYLPVFDARVSPPEDVGAILERAAGHYEGGDLIVEGGALIYRWRGRFELRLTPLTDTLFAVEGTEDYRFRLMIEEGEVVGLERFFRTGATSQYSRLGSHR